MSNDYFELEFTSSVKGDPGEDGFSPSASVERIEAEKKAIIRITDKDGTTEAEVHDGRDGTGGTTYHGDLLDREKPDQHPQAAITNLVDDLAARPDTIITDVEIWNL